jgi:hypothetical protein
MSRKTKGLPKSLYWIFLRGLRSDLTTLWACSVKYLIKISFCWSAVKLGTCWSGAGTVATDIAKAALLEHWTRSSSVAMIFFTRATNSHGQCCWVGTESDVRGKDEVPVISSGGGMAVLLYGMVESV